MDQLDDANEALTVKGKSVTSLEERVKDLSASLDAARAETSKCQSDLTTSEEARITVEKERSEVQALLETASRELEESRGELDITRREVCIMLVSLFILC